MEKFSELFDRMDQTQSTLEKVQYMKDYFSQVNNADGIWALFFLSGNRLKRLMSSKLLFELCQEITLLPTWLIEESHEAVGDTAETIALLLPESDKSHAHPLSLSEWMEKRIIPLRQLSDLEQKNQLALFWKELNRKERFILNKILTGSLRVGVSHLLTIRALSQALKIPQNILSHKLTGTWEPTAEFYETLKDAEAKGEMTPFPFYLASPIKGPLGELGEPEEWLAEWKWDGIRAQCMHRQKQFAIWSRGNELISEQFPEILEILSKLPENTVLDGELIAFEKGLPLPFGQLQKRLGRKKPSKKIIEEVPIVFIIYDIIEHDGKDLRQFPLKERREIFQNWNALDPRFLISEKIIFHTWSELEEKRLEAKNRLTEGIMLKKWTSSYGVGRQRGQWWKYKIDPMTVDAVLMYAQAGKGRRANLYTDYTFGVWVGEELVPIAKAYSGLSKEEIGKLDRWIRRNTEEKFGPVRKVKAEQVFELAFEGIQVSKRHKSGIALRFPRIARWRTDKPKEECDTLEKIKATFLPYVT